MRRRPTERSVPFFGSMVSNDWEALGYPSLKAAEFWDTRSCGVACLRMVYASLLPDRQFLPATITEDLLRDQAYKEQSGWNHSGLARHARSQGLVADVYKLSAPQELVRAALAPGVLVVSIGSSFESDGVSGHLAVIAGMSSSGQIRVHRPSSRHPTAGRDLCIDLPTFWDHFSGRVIHVREAERTS